MNSRQDRPVMRVLNCSSSVVVVVRRDCERKLKRIESSQHTAHSDFSTLVRVRKKKVCACMCGKSRSGDCRICDGRRWVQNKLHRADNQFSEKLICVYIDAHVVNDIVRDIAHSRVWIYMWVHRSVCRVVFRWVISMKKLHSGVNCVWRNFLREKIRDSSNR